MTHEIAKKTELPSSFKREVCAEHSIRDFKPSDFPIGCGVEDRYLPGETYTEINTSFKRHYYLDAAFIEYISFADPKKDLNDQVFKEAHEIFDTTRRAWGPKVLVRAKELELTQTLTPDQAKEILSVRSSYNLEESVEYEYGGFKYKGWEVFPGKNEEPILLVPNNEQNRLRFDVVNLDELYKLEPEYLKGLIKEYEIAWMKESLSNRIDYNINLHALDEAELIPDFIREIAEIKDDRKRKAEVASIVNSLEMFATLNPDYQNLLFGFVKNLTDKSVAIDEGGRSIYVMAYLKDRIECPAYDQESRLRAAKYMGILEDIKKANIKFPETKQKLFLDIKENPGLFVTSGENYGKRIKKEKLEDAVALVIFDKVKGQTYDEVLQTLKDDFPGYYETLEKFKNWMGTDVLNRQLNFDVALENATRYYYPNREVNLEEIYDNFRKVLAGKMWQTKGNFEGVWKSESWELNGKVSISNPHLEAVLPLLVLKSYESHLNPGPSKAQRVQECAKAMDTLRQNLSKKLDISIQSIEDLEKAQAEFNKFKRKLGITDQEITRLENLSTEKSSKTLEVDRFNSQTFTNLFNILVLHKEGKIDLKSKIFVNFLKKLLPNSKDIWQTILS